MKKIKLIILLNFLFATTHLMAQPNPFFPMENGVWEEAFIGLIGVPLPTYTVTCGDTLINGEVHAKFYTLTIDTMGNIMDRVYQGATKTGAETVDYIPAGANSSYLLYDFSLVTGETIVLETLFGTFSTLTVASNSLMTDNAGISRRVIFFEANPSVEIWIEGIGSNKGVLTRGITQVADYDPYMNCFKYEDILIWSNDLTNPLCEFSFTEMCSTVSTQEDLLREKVDFTFSPNPMQAETAVEIEGLDLLNDPEMRIYNLQGQLIQKIVELNEEKFSFFRKDLNAGMYVFELYDTKTTFAVRKKIIVF